ncbi:MAG: sulfotransferase family 2 domain-containing protein [Roseinatronobacter sp.]
MIISHAHEFVFVKTVKTAGTSVEIALTPICGPFDIITKLADEDEAIRIERTGRTFQHMEVTTPEGQELKFRNHSPVRRARKYLGAAYDSYFSFAFERNPFDRVVSAYHHTLRSRKSRGVDVTEWTFPNFVEAKDCQRLERLRSTGFGLYSVKDKVAVSHIYKFEDLGGAIRDIFERLDQPAPSDLPMTKISDRDRDYRSYYSPHLRKLIETHFARELEMFGYEF